MDGHDGGDESRGYTRSVRQKIPLSIITFSALPVLNNKIEMSWHLSRHVLALVSSSGTASADWTEWSETAFMFGATDSKLKNSGGAVLICDHVSSSSSASSSWIPRNEDKQHESRGIMHGSVIRTWMLASHFFAWPK